MAASAKMMIKSSAEAIKSVTLVFEQGRLAVEEKEIKVDHVPVMVVAPKDAGTYPVALLLHGFKAENHHYKHLLRHVASHGFIMVAPMMDHSIPTIIIQCLTSVGGHDDIATAVKVADWLPDGLPSVLPIGVEPELSKPAVAGHSRGGHTAFSLALGLGHAKTHLSFSALIGLDPVAGEKKDSQLRPEILSYKPSSFATAMPVLVIGTGLGEQGINVPFLPGVHAPPCAPRDVNHAEFYRECRPPCYYFVTKDYGHLDMLDDDAPRLLTCICKDGNGCKDKMRRCVAGIMVAFLKAALGEKDDGNLEAILRDPTVAPVTLDPVEHRVVKISKL